MSENSSSIEGFSVKIPKSYIYDLRLKEEEKSVPVISGYENFEKGKTQRVTDTLINSIGELLQPDKLHTFLTIGFDTEYIDIQKLPTKDGSKRFICDQLSHLNYLISTQYYATVNYIGFAGGKAVHKTSEWKDVLLHKDLTAVESLTATEMIDNRLTVSEFIHLIIDKGVKEKKLKFLPNTILLLAHFNTADIDKFKDLHTPQYPTEEPFIRRLETVRKSYSQKDTSITLQVDKQKFDFRTIELLISDTINLSPAKKGGLVEIGKLLSKELNDPTLEKTKLPEGTIENMYQLLHNNRDLFLEYSQQDAVIPVKYADFFRNILQTLEIKQQWHDTEKVTEFHSQLRSMLRLPYTLTSIGTQIIKFVVWTNKRIKTNNGKGLYDQKELDIANGYYKWSESQREIIPTQIYWQRFLGYFRKNRAGTRSNLSKDGYEKTDKSGDREDTKELYQYYKDKKQLFVDCYYGGRNEQFFYGATNESSDVPYYDYDLVSAYPSAMMNIGMINWGQKVEWKDNSGVRWDIITDYKNYAAYFQLKSFEFPESVKFPTLPIRNANKDGVIFPTKGKSFHSSNQVVGTYVTGFELYVARLLGCEIVLDEGVVFPMSFEFRPYEKFVQHTIKERRAAEKDENKFMELFWKEMMNSLYGKTAQGISSKKIFSIQEGESITLGEDDISSYAIAALITANVRSVLGLMMNKISDTDDGYFIGSVTTDGFTTDFPNEEEKWKKILDDDIFKFWIDGRSRMEDRKITSILGVDDEKQIIEEKHKVSQFIGWRTRGQATLKLNNETPSKYPVIETDHLDKEDDEITTNYLNVEELIEKIMIARAGQSTEARDDINSNLQIIWWFTNRFYGLKYDCGFIRGIRSQVESGADATNLDQSRSVSMDYDFKRQIDIDTLRVKEIEIIDTLDKMKIVYQPSKTKEGVMEPYLTATFLDVCKMDRKEIDKRIRKVEIPYFDTKPISDLDEFEDIREKWTAYRKKMECKEITINEDFDFKLGKEIWLDSKEWSDLKNRVNGTLKQLEINESGEEFLKCHINGLQSVIAYNEIKDDMIECLNNRGNMTSPQYIREFLHFWTDHKHQRLNNIKRNTKLVSGKIDNRRLVVSALILAKKNSWYGLDYERKELTNIAFAESVYWHFYSESELRKDIFKNIVDDNNPLVFKSKIRDRMEKRMNKEYNHFWKYKDVRKKWKKQKFQNIDDLNNLLLDLKNEKYNKLKVEYFNGVKEFGESVKDFDEGETEKLYKKEWDEVKLQKRIDESPKEAIYAFWKENQKLKRVWEECDDILNELNDEDLQQIRQMEEAELGDK